MEVIGYTLGVFTLAHDNQLFFVSYQHFREVQDPMSNHPADTSLAAMLHHSGAPGSVERRSVYGMEIITAIYKFLDQMGGD